MMPSNQQMNEERADQETYFAETEKQLSSICETLQQDVSQLDVEISSLGKNLGKKLNWIYDYEASTLLPALREDQSKVTEETRAQLKEVCTSMQQGISQLDADVNRMNKDLCRKLKWIFDYESDTLLPALQEVRDKIMEDTKSQMMETCSMVQDDILEVNTMLNRAVEDLNDKQATVQTALDDMRRRKDRQEKMLLGLFGVNTIGILVILAVLLF